MKRSSIHYQHHRKPHRTYNWRKTVIPAPIRTGQTQLKPKQEEIQRMLNIDVIEAIQSEWMASIVLASKKDGSLRFFYLLSSIKDSHRSELISYPSVELMHRLDCTRCRILILGLQFGISADVICKGGWTQDRFLVASRSLPDLCWFTELTGSLPTLRRH